MGGLSAFHWLIILAIAFLLFGNRLPSVMRSLGQGVVEFKKGLQGVEDDVKSAGASNSNRIAEEPPTPPSPATAKSTVEHGSPDAAPR
jgi:sec-independent protein translocase protein TatA